MMHVYLIESQLCNQINIQLSQTGLQCLNKGIAHLNIVLESCNQNFPYDLVHLADSPYPKYDASVFDSITLLFNKALLTTEITSQV